MITKQPNDSTDKLMELIRPELANYMGHPSWISTRFSEGLPVTRLSNHVLGQYGNQLGGDVTGYIVERDHCHMVDYGISLSSIRFHVGKVSGRPMLQLFSPSIGDFAYQASRASGTCLYKEMFNDKCDAVAPILQALSEHTFMGREEESPRAVFIAVYDNFRVLTMDDMGDKELLRIIADPA